jgi:hypothetical protein
MSHYLHTRSFVAGAAVGGRRIVKLSDSKTAVIAQSATDSLIGVSDAYPANQNDTFDVILLGEAEVVAGGSINVGDWLTSDTNGAAITAAPAAGTAVNVIGRALSAASAGDFINVLLSRANVHA